MDVRTPPPHVLEHSDHSPYSEYLQLSKVVIEISIYQEGKYFVNPTRYEKTARYLFGLEIIIPGQGSMLHSIDLSNSPAHDDPPFVAS